jgi:hypothetical protein
LACRISFEACGHAAGRLNTRHLNPKGAPDMPVHRKVLKLAIAVAGSIATQAPALAEEYRGTFEQQLACTPDVWRLCATEIPDVNRIVGCLRQNTPQLSGSCRAVFESNNSVAPDPAPRRRGDQ